VPVVPVVIKNSDVLMGKGTGEARAGTIEMVFMRPIETMDRTTDEAIDQLIAETRQVIADELETGFILSQKS